MEKPWSVSDVRVLSELKTDLDLGLSNAEAKRRLSRHGKNELDSKESASALELIWRQLQSPFIYILIVAVAISLWKREYTDAAVVGAVIALNTVIGFFQEYKAERTIDTLKKVLSPQARVVRDGVEQKIAANLLVPGDVVKLEAGDRVPADLRLIQAHSLRINESSLTGESVPAHKNAPTLPAETQLADRSNVAYLSTLVVDGRAVGVVTATGMGTEIGAISREVAHVRPLPTLLQRKMTVFSHYLLGAALVVTALLFVYGLAKQIPAAEMLSIALSMLVSIVPEGLPIAVTVALSIGLFRVYKKHALIRKLSAAETLGAATVICVDKTGTLTEGQMMIEKILFPGGDVKVSGEGFSLSGDFYRQEKKLNVSREPLLRQTLEMASLATMSTISKDDLKNDEAKLLTDPTETALAVVAAKAGFYAFKEERIHPEVLEIPFDQELRYSASVHKNGRSNRYIVKGSPERILSLSTHFLSENLTRRRLLRSSRSELEQLSEEQAALGYRIVALAFADNPSSDKVHPSKVKNLTFAGFFCLIDPIRSEARQAVSRAHDAGVRIIMITGDHLLTAQAIGRKIGLSDYGEAVHAKDVTARNLDKVSIIARATPSNKLRIVEMLQRQGEVVAMTGDGVNDAPALKKADIGVAMGKTGTDVAIEASSMVLLKDNFSAIVESIEQGRLIWENLKKVVFYLVSTTFAAAAIIIAALILGLPLPLVAVQILWMNLVTDGIMSMVLTVEPPEDDLMKRPPRSPENSLISTTTVLRMVLISLVMSIGSIALYAVFLDRGVEYARTVALTSMVFFQLINIFNSRSAIASAFSMSPLTNRLLLPNLAIASALQLAAIYLPPLQKVLHTVPLDSPTLFLTIFIPLSIILADEFRKTFRSLLFSWVKLRSAAA